MKTTENLRFAPIIRVSTEQQKAKGESLNTQTLQIKEYVSLLGGVVPESCWLYSGQEHATPEQERRILDKLLQDSGNGVFDAVIVCDPSRWSRDNKRSKEGLEILKNNDIRFFVRTSEFDLWNPSQNLFLGLATEFNEFQAKEQALKSIINRINRAKRGIPTAGKLPYGRTYSVEKGWCLDTEKQEIIKQAAYRYLNGEGIPAIAKSLGMNATNLHKILTRRAGTEWECHFKNKKVNIDETVTIEIPELMDKEIREAIIERTRNNITYVRGNRKHPYILSGFIFCKKCGYMLQSYRNHSGRTYYRHPKYSKCDIHKMIPGEILEKTVLVDLVKTFGDPDLIEAAVQRATPDLAKISTLTTEKESLEKGLKKAEQQKNRLIDSVAEGLLTKTEVSERISKIRDTEESIKARLINIESELTSIPDPERIKKASKWAHSVLFTTTKESPWIILERSTAWKRKLIEQAFSGQDKTRTRLGIYIDFVDGQFVYEIKGILEETTKALPTTDDLKEVFCNELCENDIDKIYQTKSNMLSECHAHHSKRFHQ